MSGAVNVRVMSLLGLVLYVSGRDRDSTLSLFGSFINVLECNFLAQAQSCMQGLGDCCGQSGFAMVYVTDGTNVTMRFCSLKLSFCHF